VTEASVPTAGCIFCDALARGDGEPLLIHRGVRAFVILNKFPYNNGHLMVVANRHVGRLASLDSVELAEIMALTQAAERALDAVYRPHAYNVGLNLGKPAGAGVLDHLHLHVGGELALRAGLLVDLDAQRIGRARLAEGRDLLVRHTAGHVGNIAGLLLRRQRHHGVLGPCARTAEQAGENGSHGDTSLCCVHG
jgi:ATP adenylyltransferase